MMNKVYLIQKQGMSRKIEAADSKEARTIAAALGFGREGVSCLCLGPVDFVRKLNPGVY